MASRKTPAKKKAPSPFVDIHGRAFDFSTFMPAEPRKTKRAKPPPRPPARPPTAAPGWAKAAVAPASAPATAPAAPPPPPPEPTPAPTAADTAAEAETVWQALCLAGLARSRTWLASFLLQLGRRTARGSHFSPDEVQAALQTLERAGRVALGRGPTLWNIAAEERYRALPALLAEPANAQAWQAWVRAGSVYPLSGGALPLANVNSSDEAVALARLFIYSAPTLAQYQQARAGALAGRLGIELLGLALSTPFIAERWQRAEPAFQFHVLSMLIGHWNLRAPPFAPLMRWLDERLASGDAAKVPITLRLQVAGDRLLMGDFGGMHAALAGVEDANVGVLHAAALARQGRWADAAAAFPVAVKLLRVELGVPSGRRLPAPRLAMELYVMSLLASRDPLDWQQARKLCIAESGSRNPSPVEGWGLWVHAIALRLGDAVLFRGLFDGRSPFWNHRKSGAMWPCLVMAAWARQRAEGWTTQVLQAERQALLDAGLPGVAALLQAAAERLELPLTPDPELARTERAFTSFFGDPQEAWRDALAAIRALGEPAGGAAATAAPTLLWSLAVDPEGRVHGLVPYERPQGQRGPGKPRVVTLARLRRMTNLAAPDAAVLRAFTDSPYRRGGWDIDLGAAAVALVGHPALVLADEPDRLVELEEGLPQLEVLRQRAPPPQPEQAGPSSSDVFVFKLHDTITGPPSELDSDFDTPDPDATARRRDAVRVLRDAPGRARLVRINAAQRRVAELVAQRWAVPVAAQAELEAALRVLAGHFQLHSDATAGDDVPAEPRLRALLSPLGAGLQLRLAVQPFGSFGPLQQAGRGRERLLTVHTGLHLATRRDLAAEAAHRQSVLDALPVLAEADDESADDTWLLDDPEMALGVLEQLPKLPAVLAIDWPRGKPVRVLPVADQALRMQVGSSTDWLALSGELQVEEGRVLSLQWLLDETQAGRHGRFIALGDGQYLALTDALRRQLADIGALAQRDGDVFKLPASAAGWLAEQQGGSRLEGDEAWHRRCTALDEAATLAPPVPAGLQAELRSYQADGFVWMARLAHAGLGACLADDMGLGKTVQTLALLLHRAALGPALVLAPTSVCANWAAEAARFAPTLVVTPYGEADREAALAGASAGQVVIASYALAHLNADAFERIEWATLVLDEAQALKNAATQRAKSVARLSANFKLALTGTPVENRLADLWSIFNLLNPGLLGSANRFNERFAAPIERQRDDAVRSRLRRVVAPFLLRRTKAQVLSDLPPRTEIVHRVVPGSEERAFLEALRRAAVQRVAEAAAKPDGHAGFQVLAELMRLRRAACDPRLVAPELGLIGAKTLEFEQLAIELVAGRHKALVFSQFTDFLKLLGERLTAAGLSYQYLDGSTPAAERAKRVAAFQAGVGDLFLISLKAGGFGLNLTAADYVLIVDPWWNPAAEDQALGRAHRIGQLRPVTVYRLVTAGSVEERIVTLHHDKRALADGVLEGQDGGAALTAADLQALLSEV